MRINTRLVMVRVDDSKLFNFFKLCYDNGHTIEEGCVDPPERTNKRVRSLNGRRKTSIKRTSSSALFKVGKKAKEPYPDERFKKAHQALLKIGEGNTPILYKDITIVLREFFSKDCSSSYRSYFLERDENSPPDRARLGILKKVGDIKELPHK